MEGRRTLLLALILKRRRKAKQREARRKNRRFWVHPLLEARYVDGAFYTLFEKLLQHQEKFFNYFRMSPETFSLFVERLSESIRKENTTMRLSIPPKEMLAVTLR